MSCFLPHDGQGICAILSSGFALRGAFSIRRASRMPFRTAALMIKYRITNGIADKIIKRIII